MGLSVLCLWLLLDGVAAGPWTYDRCDAAVGPSAWQGGCQVQGQQSPVNLCGAKGHSFAPIQLRGYDAPIQLAPTNASLQFDVRGGHQPTSFIAGDLAAVVGNGNASETPQWQLAQVHFHVGPVGSTEDGSEHYLQGRSFPLEVHLLHFNYQYGTTLESAVRNSAAAADALLVVSILFHSGKKDTQLVKAVAAALSKNPQARAPLTVHLADSFDSDGPFYAYAGSLTTPPCPHPVTWLVLQRSQTVTPAALAALQAALPGSGRSQVGNGRPLQPLGGRVVYSSAGPTARCRPVEEPPPPCGGRVAVVANAVASAPLFQPSLAVQTGKSRVMPLPLSLAILLVGMLLASFAVRATRARAGADDPPSSGSTTSGDRCGDHVPIPSTKKPRPTSQYGPSYGTLSHSDRPR
eukprot:EG_transcript_10060